MRDVVAYVVGHHGYSERQACLLTRQHLSTQRKPSIRDPRLEIRQRMHEIAATRIRFGYRRVHIMLRRDGWTVGKNLVWRLYRGEGLALHSQAATPAQDGRAPRSKVPAEPAQ
jgi:putative transposase